MIVLLKSYNKYLKILRWQTYSTDVDIYKCKL